MFYGSGQDWMMLEVVGVAVWMMDMVGVVAMTVMGGA